MPSAALVTGAGQGIGAACAAALAAAGHDLTLLDLKAPTALAADLSAAHGVRATAAALDIRDDAAQAAAFASAGAATPGGRGLDVVILNAGIFESGPFFEPGDAQAWQACLDVDLRANLAGIRAAAAVMRKGGQGGSGGGSRDVGGAIVVIASAGGLYPMPAAPVYSASKAGLVQFVRSAARGLHGATGVRLTALCPEAVETALYRGAVAGGAPAGSNRRLASKERVVIPVLDPADVADAALALASDATAVGTVLMVHAAGALLEWAHPRGNLVDAGARFGGGRRGGKGGGAAGAPPSPAWAAWAGGADPAARRAVVVVTLSPDFAAATRLQAAPLAGLARAAAASTPPSIPRPPFFTGIPAGHLLVRRTFAGVNASDVNFSAGRYGRAGGGTTPPFEAGFEAVGVVAAVGPGVDAWRPGDAVAELGYGCYADCGLVRADRALPLGPLPPGPAAVALLTSGLTAELGLSVSLAGRPLRVGDTVLVTAAAGGTGQFVCQLAAAAGARVLAVVGGPAKAALVTRLGAAVAIDHREAAKAPGGLAAAIKAAAPGGVDVAWESVGGATFEAVMKSLKAPGGRVIVIGMMEAYKDPAWGAATAAAPPPTAPPLALPELLLWRGASATGFFLLHHARRFGPALAKLARAVADGRLSVAVDDGGERFIGLASVPAAVARLQSGRSVGKVVVQLCDSLPPGVPGVGEESRRARL